MKIKHIFYIISAYFVIFGCGKAPMASEYQKATYMIYGNVTDYESSEKLENITVFMYEISANNSEIKTDSAQTDRNGYFEVENNEATPYLSDNYRLYFIDKNKIYKDTAANIVFVDESFYNGDKQYYAGETSLKFNIALEKIAGQNLNDIKKNNEIAGCSPQ
ncbi:MAG: radical SAM-associated putative lipoprotein [Prevotellaceae bacterium]|jgi:putative lipoprotein (rSAM/lipoprotein system)|nr:radical SAM-associated putative lipoprotein [Prevotellaceae bacterium]